MEEPACEEITRNLPVGPKLMGKTMSSLEIAELMGKEHKNVLRDIKTLIAQGALTALNYELSEYKDSSGKMNPMINLDFIGTMILITGYDAKRRALVVNRWSELEQEKLNNAIPDFSNPAAAARAWAEQYEQRLLAEQTKAQIGHRREATAMATASVTVVFSALAGMNRPRLCWT